MNKMYTKLLELAVSQKSEQFEKFLVRVFHLTSDVVWSGTLTTSKEGYYFKLENARSSFSVFLDCHGHVKRKPVTLSGKVKTYEIRGYETEIQKVYLTPSH